MKAMQCELCGATEIVKDGDFFVCQSCGMKYTPESAKKMVIEGVVQVEGTISLDESLKLKNYIDRAESLLDEKRYLEAYQECREGLHIDSMNPYLRIIALFADYAPMSKELDWCKKGEKIGEETSSCLKEIHNQIGDCEDFGKVCAKYLSLIKALETENYFACRTAAKQADVELIAVLGTININGSYSDSSRMKDKYAIEAKKKDAENGLFDGFIGTAELAQTILELIKDPIQIGRQNLWTMHVYTEGASKFDEPLYQSRLKKIQQEFFKYTKMCDDFEEKQKKIEQEKKAKEYWDKHPDKKIAINSLIETKSKEQEEIDEQIRQLQEKIDRVNQEVPLRFDDANWDIKKNLLQNELEEIAQKISGLSVFSFKKKKKLDALHIEKTEQLDQLNSEKKKALSIAKRKQSDAIKELTSPLEEEKDRLITKRKSLEKLINKKTEELENPIPTQIPKKEYHSENTSEHAPSNLNVNVINQRCITKNGGKDKV